MSALTKPMLLSASIYEVDELVDGMISWDEFILTYRRNIADKSGIEPSHFFHLMEFALFDTNHKGRIVEDDVMEVMIPLYPSGVVLMTSAEAKCRLIVIRRR